jgi:hypothetical protein
MNPEKDENWNLVKKVFDASYFNTLKQVNLWNFYNRLSKHQITLNKYKD